MVVVLIVLLGAKAVAAGFPAIADGDLPLSSLHVDEHLPEAFAVMVSIELFLPIHCIAAGLTPDLNDPRD